MKSKRYIFLAALIICLSAFAGQVQAKDLIFTMGYGKIEVIDGATDTVAGSIPLNGWARDYTFTPDKKRMVVTTNRHYVNIIDTEKLKLVKTLELNDNKEGWDRFVYGMTAAPDNKTVYVHMLSRRTEGGEAIIGKPVVCQIDLSNGEILRSVEVPRGVFTLLSVDNGKEIYAIGLDIHKIDVSGKRMKLTETHTMFDKGMNILALWHYTFENDGYFVAPYYCAEGCGMLEIDTHSGKISESIVNGVPPMVYNFMYSPDRTKVYGAMDELYKIDMKTKTITDYAVINEGTNFALIVSSDGKKVYTGAGGSSVTVFDADTLKPLKVINMAEDAVSMARLKI